MIVKVDTRESALFQQMLSQISFIPVFKNIQIKSETLPIGDIIISDGTEDKIVIERKSVNDLLSSIKDGRYEEQSYRLNGLNHHNHNIVYLIEGDVNKMNRFKSETAVEKLTLYSAMFSLNYYKGFSVFRSFNMEETANIICNMAYKIGKDQTKKPYYQNISTVEMPINESGDTAIVTNECNSEELEVTEKDYVNVIKKVKKDNITPDNIGEIMLCQIPGVSSVTALAIMQKFDTIANLIVCIKQDPKCLKDISYTNAKQQVRKVSKTALQNVVQYLAT